ncbi:MAG: InlB B-repeat-containing protein [Oscillospiraceae bacterium]|jgi:uncharacterized repeat protein (TIGR02543 family)|nr:InlB B-repeat-containing protein [Oscillospiraceae bacterium]
MDIMTQNTELTRGLYYVDSPASFFAALGNNDNEIDIVVTSAFILNGKVKFPEGSNISISSAESDSPQAIIRGFLGDMFEIPAGTSVSLTDIVIAGDNASYTDASGSLFLVSGSADGAQPSLTIGRGATLRDNQTNTSYGMSSTGGVRVVAGTVLLEEGGTITKNNSAANNSVGGVALFGPESRLVMRGGEISHNAGQFGSGVYVDVPARFDMYGGSIVYNISTPGGHGAGVDAAGTFNMYGGSISYNSSSDGGGLSVHSTGNVNIHSGSFIGNTAPGAGGHGAGILFLQPPDNDLIIGMEGGTVNFTDNISGGPGGAIGTSSIQDLRRLYVGPNVTFSGNKASQGYFMTNPNEIDIYDSRIQAVQVSEPFQYAYNGYDIQYSEYQPDVYAVQFNSIGGSMVPPQAVDGGHTAVRPRDPVRGCDIFSGWFRDITFTLPWDFVMPVNSNMLLYAKWIPNACSA